MKTNGLSTTNPTMAHISRCAYLHTTAATGAEKPQSSVLRKPKRTGTQRITKPQTTRLGLLLLGIVLAGVRIIGCRLLIGRSAACKHRSGGTATLMHHSSGRTATLMHHRSSGKCIIFQRVQISRQSKIVCVLRDRVDSSVTDRLDKKQMNT